MQVAALLVAGSATMEGGAINAMRIPTTSYELDQIPMWLTIPVITVVHAAAGGDYDPELFVVCKDPAGERRGGTRSVWHWPDDDNKPSKYRCFSFDFSFAVESQGEYTIGAYRDADATDEIASLIPVLVTLAISRQVGSNGS